MTATHVGATVIALHKLVGPKKHRFFKNKLKAFVTDTTPVLPIVSHTLRHVSQQPLHTIPKLLKSLDLAWAVVDPRDVPHKRRMFAIYDVKSRSDVVCVYCSKLIVLKPPYPLYGDFVELTWDVTVGGTIIASFPFLGLLCERCSIYFMCKRPIFLNHISKPKNWMAAALSQKIQVTRTFFHVVWVLMSNIVLDQFFWLRVCLVAKKAGTLWTWWQLFCCCGLLFVLVGMFSFF